MRKILPIFIGILVIVLFTQCRHRSRVFKTYFWTSSAAAENDKLYINNHYIGEIPFLEEGAAHNKHLLKHEGLFIKLRSGKYRVEMRDDEGNVKYTETIRIKYYHNISISVSADDQDGGSRRIIDGDNLIEEINY